MMIDCFGSLFRPKTATLPILMAKVGPKSVRGIHVGPFGSVVRKLVVFQMPPEAPPTYTVLPEGSDESTATDETKPELLCSSRLGRAGNEPFGKVEMPGVCPGIPL